MLLSLTIRNIALIDDLTISLHEGFHVLTGETGAGKSIIVDAVNLLLGGRSDRDLVRTGCDKAYVEAMFDIRNNEKILELLALQQMEADDGVLTISREISLSGKNICRIMGMVMPLALLKEFTVHLVDVHGQHEHQFLMEEDRHLKFLDSFGDKVHQQKMKDALAALEAYRSGEKERSRLLKESAQREQRLDMLRFQLQELKAAKLKPGEEEVLKRELERLRHSVKISEALRRAYDDLYSGSGKQLSALALMKNAVSALDGISALDSEYEKLRDKIKDHYYELEECGLSLRSLSTSAEFDPERNEQLEARLDLIRRLQRKYGTTVEEMIAYTQKISLEYESFQRIDETVDELTKRQEKFLKLYNDKASLLTKSRKQLATWFDKEMMEQLAHLGMGKTQFAVQFSSIPADDQVPYDHVAFLISTNPGEPLKPLSKIASGGELSRLMLAIKSIAAKQGLVPTMIFDEIDTGISGKIAQVVAEKMAKISVYRQVLCVTHLPAIAAMADYHYLVEKEVHEGRTFTGMTELDITNRERELARMVGGTGAENDSGLLHARMLLLSAASFKNSIMEEEPQSAVF